MNGAFEVLVSLAFFIPMAATVALDLAMYRVDRYAPQPPARATHAAAENATIRVEAPHELRKAA